MSCRGEFQNRRLASEKKEYCICFVVSGLNLADITGAVTVLKITHFTAGAGGCLEIDLRAIRSRQLIIAKYSH